MEAFDGWCAVKLHNLIENTHHDLSARFTTLPELETGLLDVVRSALVEDFARLG